MESLVLALEKTQRLFELGRDEAALSHMTPYP